MVEKRFAELFDALRNAGIARRSARRAASEIEDHFNQLTRDAVSRGASESDARLAAHAALGTNQTLIERYAARPELRAWSSRWPALWFMLMPIGCYLALAVLCMTVLVLAMNRMSAYLHGIHVAARPVAPHRSGGAHPVAGPVPRLSGGSVRSVGPTAAHSRCAGPWPASWF